MEETETHRVLVVDDDSDVRFMLQRYLRRHGFEVEAVPDGAGMRQMIDRRTCHLIVLDLSLPGEDGLTLARWLRERSTIPIIMLTAAAEVVDRVVGLEVGADDYMTKPFEPRELLARIRSVLRRAQAKRRPSGAAAGEPRVRFGATELDLESHHLFDAAGDEIPITAMEFDLLKAFADHPDRVLSRDRLLDLAHNRERDPFDRSIDIRIARLRRKIETDPRRPTVIKTVRGAGYMFVSDSD